VITAIFDGDAAEIVEQFGLVDGAGEHLVALADHAERTVGVAQFVGVGRCVHVQEAPPFLRFQTRTDRFSPPHRNRKSTPAPLRE